jgi:hypothetical protein
MNSNKYVICSSESVNRTKGNKSVMGNTKDSFFKERQHEHFNKLAYQLPGLNVPPFMK